MLIKLEEKIGYRFSNPSLLKGALSHPSLGGERPSPYERLEFLGDRVLSLVVADLLFKTFPQDSEGDLSRRHTSLVRKETLVLVAKSIQLGEFLEVAKGETPWSSSILSDGCEALMGALYLDGGFERVAHFIETFWGPLVKDSRSGIRDPKSTLQEWVQAKGLDRPVYSLYESQGPAHSPVFCVEVKVSDSLKAQGKGSSKRAAEQEAAQALLKEMGVSS